MTATTNPRRIAVPFHRGLAADPRQRGETPDPANLRAVRAWVRDGTRPTVVDLFCGAGGLSLGLRDAGFTILVGADSDPNSVRTHAANLGCLSYHGDLAEPGELLERLDTWGVRAVDVVAGGPPCQPFSRAGRSKIRDLVRAGVRTHDDPRAQLWRSFMAVVEHLRPRAVLVENVPDLPSWDDGAVLIGFLESLRDFGYEVEAAVLDAFAHGVPQHRARLFIAGVRDGEKFRWPRSSSRVTTLRDAIGDLPVVPAGFRDERIEYRAMEGRTAFQRAMRRGLAPDERAWVHDHITRAVRADDAEAFGLMAEGQTYEDLPDRLRRYRSDIFTDKYKRLAWDEVSRSITAHIAKDGYWYIHPEQHRTLSIREAARVQTFPDWFRFAGEPSHRYRQIGNGVPPLLGRAVGRSLIAALRDRSSRGRGESSTGARDELLTWHGRHARRYAWRGLSLTPWQVLMAEMCLHRTRADQVAPVFDSLRRLAPTPRAMVEHAEEARAAMRSLGLRWRAENLIRVAHVLADEYDGVVPDSELGLRSLPGVGDYVAQAVLCFGFGRRAVLLDTNTMRIVGRLFGRDNSRRWQLRLDLHRLAGVAGPDAAFNYALLDLGALVCRAGTPRCEVCPLRRRCATAAGAESPAQLTTAVAP